MYVVVRTGGKQYCVSAGDILEVEKLEGDIGQTVTLEDVLLVSNGDDVMIGQPNVEDVSVHAKITGQHRGKKIIVFRYRPKKRIRVRKGHRQYRTRLVIESIVVNGETYVADKIDSTSDVASDVEVGSGDEGIGLHELSQSAGLADDLSVNELDKSEATVKDSSSDEDVIVADEIPADEINTIEESSDAQPELDSNIDEVDSVEVIDEAEMSAEEDNTSMEEDLDAKEDSPSNEVNSDEESSDIQVESNDDEESSEVDYR